MHKYGAFFFRSDICASYRIGQDRVHTHGGSTISSRCPSRRGPPILESAAPPRRLDRGDVYLFHWHHPFERALGRCGIAVGERGNKGARSDLPRHAPPVLNQPHWLSWPPFCTIAFHKRSVSAWSSVAI